MNHLVEWNFPKFIVPRWIGFSPIKERASFNDIFIPCIKKYTGCPFEYNLIIDLLTWSRIICARTTRKFCGRMNQKLLKFGRILSINLKVLSEFKALKLNVFHLLRTLFWNFLRFCLIWIKSCCYLNWGRFDQTLVVN